MTGDPRPPQTPDPPPFPPPQKPALVCDPYGSTGPRYEYHDHAYSTGPTPAPIPPPDPSNPPNPVGPRVGVAR